MKVLQKMITSRFAMGVSYAAALIGNRIAGAFPWVRRRRERNRRIVSAYPRDLVFGQDKLRTLPYGARRMDYNGCEVIAVYNALLLSGHPAALSQISSFLERRGLFLGGIWGTHVSAIPACLRAFGGHPKVFRNVRSAPEDFRVGILSFWNDGNRLRSGVHTVVLERRNGEMRIYNLQGKDTSPTTGYDSPEDLILQRGILPIQIVIL